MRCAVGRAQVLAGDGAMSGTARGVDEDGALLLESGGRMQRFVSGEVSLRLTEGDGVTILKSIVVCLALANVGYFLWVRGIGETPRCGGCRARRRRP